ncbi:hypothetical protein BH09PSE6_BH09PSE6_17930 [soil metagenome]
MSDGEFKVCIRFGRIGRDGQPNECFHCGAKWFGGMYEHICRALPPAALRED